MRFLVLYIPFLFSLACSGALDLSYWIAWLGSWFILWYSLAGWLTQLPEGLPWYNQMLRPFALPQIVFAGFTCLSSVFYYFSVHGFLYFDHLSNAVNLPELERVVKAQQNYLLAHIALVHGLFIRLDPRKPQYALAHFRDPGRTLRLLLIFFLVAIVLRFVPGFAQWKERMQDLAFVTSVFLLAYAIVGRTRIYFIYAGLIFAYLMLQALFSGFKELVLMPLLILTALLFPRMKKATITLFLPGVVIVAVALPIFTATFRNLAWKGQTDRRIAAAAALAAIQDRHKTDTHNANWEFLINRLSEIGMFTKYIKNVPEFRPFYESKIIEQAVLSLVPRIIFPSKPSTEHLVTERVLENGIIEDYSLGKVSAKPMLPVDGYISFGSVGVWVFLFFMGITASFASREAERLFGGYTWGTCVAYTGLFQILWRGNCLEFLVNSVVYAFILMYLLFYIGRKTGYIVPVSDPR